MNKKTEYSRMEYIMLYTGFVIIMLIGLYDVNDHYCLTIINDEFAYWANAAQMAGKDWTGMMSTSSFYSYGYSLLLVPLIGMGISMQMVYRIAIIMNTLLLAGSFLLTYWLSRQLFGRNGESRREENRIDNRILIFISLVVTLYINNIFQMKVAWTEILLYFMFWVVAVLIYRVLLPILAGDGNDEKPRVADILLLAFATVYIYTVHNRAIGVMLVVISMILFFYIKSLIAKKPENRLLICLAVMVILFIPASVFRQYTIDNWYGAVITGDKIGSNSENVANLEISVNDYSGQVSKFRALLTPQGIMNLLLSLSGKIYYQATASFLLILLPVISVLGVFFTSLISWIRRKSFRKWSIHEWVFFFCVAAYVMEIGIAAFYKSGPVAQLRAVDVLYGRYSEFAAGPVILFAIAMILRKQNLLKEVAIGAFIYLLCAVSVGYQLHNIKNMFLNINNATAIYRFFVTFESPLILTLAMTLAGLGGFILVIGGALLGLARAPGKGRRKKSGIVHEVLVLSAVGAICLYWCITGVAISANWVTINGEGGRWSMRGILTTMAELPEDTVMYYVDTPGDIHLNFIKIYQSLDPDRDIRFIEMERALYDRPEGNNVYISFTHVETLNLLGTELEGLMLTDGLALFAPPGQY